MTLLTGTPSAPPAGGQSSGTSNAATPPSSGDVKPAVETQKAADKAPTGTPTTEQPAGKADSNPPGEKPATEKVADKPADKQVAPAKFTYKPSPEGLSVDPEVADALSGVAGELGLTNEAAQKIVDKVSPALNQRAARNTRAMIDGWITESQAAFGEKLTAEIGFAQRALHFATPELRQLLASPTEGGTGLGNHKAVIAGLAAIGRKLSPDAKIVSGTEVSPPPKSAQERLAGTYETVTPS